MVTFPCFLFLVATVRSSWPWIFYTIIPALIASISPLLFQLSQSQLIRDSWADIGRLWDLNARNWSSTASWIVAWLLFAIVGHTEGHWVDKLHKCRYHTVRLGWVNKHRRSWRVCKTSHHQFARDQYFSSSIAPVPRFNIIQLSVYRHESRF